MRIPATPDNTRTATPYSGDASRERHHIGRNITHITNMSTEPDWKIGGRRLHALAQQPVSKMVQQQSSTPPGNILKLSVYNFFLSLLTRNITTSFYYTVDNDGRHISSAQPVSTLPLLSRSALLPTQTRTRRAAGNPPVDPGISHSIKPQDRQHNLATIDLLQRNAGWQQDCPDAAFSSRLATSAVSFLSQDKPHRQEQLAQSIALDQGYDEEGTDIIMPSVAQQLIIRNWIAHLLFGGSIADFIVQQLAHQDKTSQWKISDLYQLLQHQIRLSLDPDPSDQQGSTHKEQIVSWIWDHVITETMPMLSYHEADPVMAMTLNDPRWGKIHAGLLFARRNALTQTPLPPTKALTLGKMLLVLIEEKAIPHEVHTIFLLPARCYLARLPHALNAGKNTDQTSTSGALERYFRMQTSFLQTHAPLPVFVNQMKNFKSRREWAIVIHQTRCHYVDIDTLLNDGGGICPSNMRQRYPDPTTKFDAQNQRIADAFANIDHLDVLTSWLRLSREELDFIRAADIYAARAEVDLLRIGTNPPEFIKILSPLIFVVDDVIPEKTHQQFRTYLQGMELFIAIASNGDERVYEMDKHGRQYAVRRVHQTNRDADDDTLTKLLLYGDTMLNYAMGNVKIRRTQGDVLQHLVENIVKSHREAFYQTIHTRYFDQTSQEYWTELALSFVPFYTCAKEITEEHLGAALFSCGADLLIAVPLLGELAELTSKVGASFYRGAQTAIEASSELVARGAIKQAVRKGFEQFAQHGLQSALQQIGTDELRSLSVTLLRTIDPGLELATKCSTKALKEIFMLGQRMAHLLPDLKHLLPTLQRKLDAMAEKTQASAIAVINEPPALRPVNDGSARLAGISPDESMSQRANIPQKTRQSPGQAAEIQDNTHPVRDAPKENAGLPLSAAHIPSTPTAQDIKDWRAALLENEGLALNLQSFAQQRGLDQTIWLSLVEPDGSVTNAGLQLIAQQERRHIAYFPSAKLIEEWNTSARNSLISFALASKYQVEHEDFVLSLPVVLRLRSDGSRLSPRSNALPWSNPNVVIEADLKSTDQLPYIKSRSDNAAIFDTQTNTRESVIHLEQINQTYPEHQLIWASLRPQQREQWGLASFARKFDIDPISWGKLVTPDGKPLKYWFPLGELWNQGPGVLIDREKLNALQHDYPKALQDGQDLDAFAKHHHIPVALLSRWLHPDGTLTEHGLHFFHDSLTAIAGPNMQKTLGDLLNTHRVSSFRTGQVSAQIKQIPAETAAIAHDASPEQRRLASEPMRDTPKETIRLLQSGDRAATHPAVQDIKDWRAALLTKEAPALHLHRFAQQRGLDQTIWLSLVESDGSVTHAGLCLIAQEEGRSIANLPSAKMFDDWNASARDNAALSSLASQYQIAHQDFVLSLPVVLRLRTDGSLFSPVSGALPRGETIILNEAPSPEIPVINIINNRWNFFTIIEKEKNTRQRLVNIERINNTRPELQLVWINLTQQQRNEWRRPLFASTMNVPIPSWENLVTLDGELLKYWEPLELLMNTGTQVSRHTFTVLQREYPKALLRGQTLEAFAEHHKIPPILIFRWLNTDGTLKPPGIHFIRASIRAAEGPLMRTSVTDLLATPRYPIVPESLAHALVWLNLSTDRRDAFTLSSFAKKFRISYDLWKSIAMLNGNIRFYPKFLGELREPGLAETLMTPEILLNLQKKWHASPIKTGDEFDAFNKRENPANPIVVGALLNMNGELTYMGSRFITIFHEAMQELPSIPHPQAPISDIHAAVVDTQVRADMLPDTTAPLPVLSSSDIAPPPSVDEVSQRAKSRRLSISLDTLDQASIRTSVIVVNPQHAVSAQGGASNAQGNIVAGSPGVAPITLITVKSEIPAMPVFEHHEINNDLPLIQNPDDSTESFLPKLGLVENMNVEDWSELLDAFKPLTSPQRAQIKRQLQNKMREFLTLSIPERKKILEKNLQISYDLTTLEYGIRGVAAKHRLPQFTLLGAYQGALHDAASEASISQRMRQAGAGHILAYLWNTPGGQFIDAYKRGNTLSLINTAQMKTGASSSTLAQENNVSVVFLKEIPFYITNRDVDAGTELLVNYGENYDPFNAIKHELGLS